MPARPTARTTALILGNGLGAWAFKVSRLGPVSVAPEAYGVYRIAEVYARSWVFMGTIVMPKRLAS